MKKLFALVLVLILIVSMCACNNTQLPNDDNKQSQSQGNQQTPNNDEPADKKYKLTVIDYWDYLRKPLDEYYEAGLLKADTTILLLNMELRNVFIQGYGKCEFYISNDRIEHMLDDIIIFHLADDRYYEGMTLFIDEVVYYMGQDAGVSFEYEDGQDYGETYNGLTEYYHVSLTPAQALGSVPFGLIALIACAIGGISLAVMASSSGGKVTINNRSYLDNAHSGLTASRDDYVRTTVTKRRKPQENNTSSGPRSSGGGGRSSGGHSHSGGSRGF